MGKITWNLLRRPEENQRGIYSNNREHSNVTLRTECKLECSFIPRIWGSLHWNSGELRSRKCRLTWYLLRNKCGDLTFVCPCIVSIIVIDDQKYATFWYIYLFPISSKCFGRCFRQSSGALDLFTASDIVHLCCCRPVSSTRRNCSSISSMKPAGSNIGGLNLKL